MNYKNYRWIGDKSKRSGWDVIGNILKFKFDFDDAYQYSVAQKYDLTIVSFDKDFNAKGIKKQTPDEIVENK